MEYKLVVFDLDGTLYNLDDVIPMVYEMQIEYITKHLPMTRLQAIELFERNNIYPYKSIRSKSATELFLKLGINREDWGAFRSKNFDETYINPKTAVSKEILDAFAKAYPIVLISSNTFENIQKILRRINIPTSLFKRILCSDDSQGIFNKKELFIKAIKMQQAKYEETVSIGDRFHTDVEPLVQLGGKGIVVQGPAVLSRLLLDMQNNAVISNEEYCVYDK